MRTTLSTTPNWSDEDLRLRRMAHGTRAVAAAVIVGGIVIAALESEPTSERFRALETTPAVSGFAAGESEPGTAPAAIPEPRDADPALRRIDRGMENHG